ncbi:fatty acid desaturase family protein [Nocardioides daeguensis]|uniref:Acyl-CoA desaturase n=1 Tax=Nocardioides daeguensis TaxID=908359 RepID=A0ABP6V4N9_9ACTN|nr:acyl-CoA desaturase [Nocardioides daeguensis]MBV6726453.1 acyl-CoA desaturase [Nocardioides daeguensis]MCR1772296.1 acyl-CoA desaturase [Nocardioides daeguensis]
MSTTDSVHPPPRSDYGELVREIRRRGLLHPRPDYYLRLGALDVGCLAALVLALVALRDSWWAVALAPAFAVVSTQIAFLSHDAAHRQVVRGRRATMVACLVLGNMLNGLSYGWWVAKHDAHHAHPNDPATDPDVAPGAFVFDPAQAGDRAGAAAWMTRHQAVLFFPLLTLEAFNLRVEGARALLRTGFRNRSVEAVLLVGHVALYLGLVISTLTWVQGLVFVVVHQALFGVYLGCSFAPSHKGMPVPTAVQSADPLLRQVVCSRNIRGGPFLDLALGGLNLQIEHHLFPSMPRPNLRLAQPIVRRHCQERDIPYAEATLVASYGSGLRHLRQVGTALRLRTGTAGGSRPGCDR